MFSTNGERRAVGGIVRSRAEPLAVRWLGKVRGSWSGLAIVARVGSRPCTDAGLPRGQGVSLWPNRRGLTRPSTIGCSVRRRGLAMTDLSHIRYRGLVDKVMSAEEAAALIEPGSNVGMSGFTGAGYPKAVPAALARRITEASARGEHFKVGVWTGASTAPELDGALASVEGIDLRMPYNPTRSAGPRSMPGG